MLIRYRMNEHGKRQAIAKVFTEQDFSVRMSDVDPDAVLIVDRLKKNGFEAYIVGGAVRDLLLGKIPKDFDISTDANPKQIRKLFWNSRIIGRRFKLVHIYFQEKIFEVSTFRSNEIDPEQGNNVYGTIEQDAKRRDFSINGLYFDPIEKHIVDFGDYYKDITSRRMRSIIPLNETFIEDPVRMIRCIKYSVAGDFTIPFRLDRAIKKYADELHRCSSSRMTEEVFKILQTGYSKPIFERLIHYRLFRHVLPGVSDQIDHGKNRILSDQLYESLSTLDGVIRHNENVTRARMLAGLVDPFLSFPDEYENSLELFRSVFKQIKQIIAPITPPNYEVEKSVEFFFKNENIKVPKNAVRKPNNKKPPVKTQKQQRRRRPQKSRKKGSSAKGQPQKGQSQNGKAKQGQASTQGKN